jgi:hypothetical protein
MIGLRADQPVGNDHVLVSHAEFRGFSLTLLPLFPLRTGDSYTRSIAPGRVLILSISRSLSLSPSLSLSLSLSPSLQCRISVWSA